jgi:hypothetical protein
MAAVRQKFATQVDAELLGEVRAIADREGRQIQALVEEALRALVEERKHGRARPEIMAHYHGSHERFASLYERLAK